MTKQFCNGCQREMTAKEVTESDYRFSLRGVNFILERAGCTMDGVDVHLCAECIVKELSAGIAANPTFLKS